MKSGVQKPIMDFRNIEIMISFIISLLLIFLFLSRPESDLMKAVVDNDMAKLRQLIKVSKKLDSQGPCRKIPSSFTTPLIAAAWLERREIALELINAGADVNARDDFGTTPLLAALSRGDIQLSSALLEKGANPNLPTCLGHGSCTTALRCAHKLNNRDLIKRIESVGGREDTPALFPLECFWLDVRPVVFFILTRIIPLILIIMLSGCLIRKAIRGGNRKEIGGSPRHWTK